MDCIDIDGNNYKTVKIGNQIWMAENLKVTHYNNGVAIPNIIDRWEWTSLITGAYCENLNDQSYLETYGRLYNWYAIDDERGICPRGWHVPSVKEWMILTEFLGPEGEGTWGNSIAGGKMKEAGLAHWNSPNSGATNESGFTCLPAGGRDKGTGHYFNIGSEGIFWFSDDANNYGRDGAFFQKIVYDSSFVGGSNILKKSGLSVRCLLD